MRFRVTHETAYRYQQPAAAVTQVLRMTPRGHDGQFIVDWRIELAGDNRLRASADAFGNIMHSFALPGPISAVTVTAIGEVETEDTHGLVKGQIERFPPAVFLRDTRLTEADAELRQFAVDVTAGAGDRLSVLHALNTAVHERMRFDKGPTDASTTAREAFASGHGVCQDYAHVFVAAARQLEIPARYVGGYLFQKSMPEQDAGHGWAEALVEDLGWVAFDPANGVSATDAYVRVAVGLDYLGAAPVRGAQFGGAGEALAVSVRVEETRSRSSGDRQFPLRRPAEPV
jgi:transglutaminase-like putative cysteine protease